MAIHIIPFAAAPDADRFATSVTTDWIRHPGKGDLYFAVIEGAGGTGTGAITVNCSATSAGGSTSAVTFDYKTVTSGADFDTAGGYTTGVTTVTPAAGASKTTLVKVRFDALTSGKPFVALTVTEVVNDPVDAAIVAFVEHPPRPNSGISMLA